MMLKINHYLGGIFLVSGTAIGAAMLALPVMTSAMGFFPSMVLFFICWSCMLISAFFFLDVNLSVKGEPNLISMAERTLGTWGKVVSWIFYLLLLYSLIAAYIAGSGPVFLSAIQTITSHSAPTWVGSFMLPLIFGGFIYLGTEGVDVVNRVLMFGLIVSYILLVFTIPSHVEGQLLLHMDWKPLVLGVPLAITSFGYHVIIPTLTTYMNHNRKRLKRVIIIGSLLPLCFYVVWQALVLGVVPLDGSHGLFATLKAGEASTIPLSYAIKSSFLSKTAQFFSFFAITTSFLGLAISLSDFLIDGLKIKKSWEGKLLALGLTFIPPLLFVLTYKRGFILALEYAGAFVAVLLLFLPAVMAWKLKTPKFYQTIKAKILMIFIIFVAISVVIIDILEQLGWHVSSKI